MKKIILLFAFAIFFSCSKSDDDTNSNNGSDFHPPAWIQGTWAVSDGFSSTSKIFKFTANDFISINVSSELSWQGLLNQIKTSGGTASVEETITSTKYDFVINYSPQSTNYSFTKINNNSIKYNYIYPVTLIRVP